MKYLLLVVPVFFTACNFGCDEKRETVIVDSTSATYSIDLQILAKYRELGFDCEPSSISGTRTLYTCTKCS